MASAPRPRAYIPACCISCNSGVKFRRASFIGYAFLVLISATTVKPSRMYTPSACPLIGYPNGRRSTATSQSMSCCLVIATCTNSCKCWPVLNAINVESRISSDGRASIMSNAMERSQPPAIDPLPRVPNAVGRCPSSSLSSWSVLRHASRAMLTWVTRRKSRMQLHPRRQIPGLPKVSRQQHR